MFHFLFFFILHPPLIVCPGHLDQNAEDKDLEAGERLLQLCSEALPVGEEGGDGAEISGPRVLQF